MMQMQWRRRLKKIKNQQRKEKKKRRKDDMDKDGMYRGSQMRTRKAMAMAKCTKRLNTVNTIADEKAAIACHEAHSSLVVH